ncbi:hypothetical protein M2426_004664 [Pseudomonas moraviensis]|uniref:hypothetical protein n=2 Tax=Pseudomonas moraviensis TaxID=321662 RepID=UPI003D1D1667
MNIFIDITESFGAIDFDNAGGIISYIKIPPTENTQEKFQVEMFNFVLNLSDEPITSAIESQDPTFLDNMDEDGFLIIDKAIVTFEKIKGHEKLVRILDQTQDYLLHDVYRPKLEDKDKIYDIGERSFTSPQLLINLAIISPKKVTLEFLSSNHVYIATCYELRNGTETLNLREKRTQPPIQGVFDTGYSNLHTASDFDAGYRVYKS